MVCGMPELICANNYKDRIFECHEGQVMISTFVNLSITSIGMNGHYTVFLPSYDQSFREHTAIIRFAI